MRYISEERLVEKVQSGEYTWLDYVQRNSPEMKNDYEWFCQYKGIDPNEEESAKAFLDARDQEFEYGLNHGDA